MSPLHRGKVVLGYTDSELCRKGSGYQFIHAADMMHCAENHVRSEFGRRPQGPTPPRGAGANPPPRLLPPRPSCRGLPGRAGARPSSDASAGSLCSDEDGRERPHGVPAAHQAGRLAVGAVQRPPGVPWRPARLHRRPAAGPDVSAARGDGGRGGGGWRDLS